MDRSVGTAPARRTADGRRAPGFPRAPVVVAAAVVSPSGSGESNGNPPASLLTIGELARRSGFTIKALRFYERRGLVPASGRTAGGFRLYTEVDLHRLEFIRRAKALGLSLDQIHELVVSARSQTCSMTRPRLLGVLDEQIRRTTRQIAALTELKAELQRRRRALARRPPTDHGRGYCPCFHDSQSRASRRQIPARRPGR